MTTSSAMLCDFRVLDPPYAGDQPATIEWLAAAHVASELSARAPVSSREAAEIVDRVERRVLRFGSATQRIRTRRTFLKDFLHREWDKMDVYRLHADPAGAGASERMQVYARVAEDAFERLYATDEPGPEVLLHVSCTGYASPSAAQRLVARRGWHTQTEVIHVYHMGCYASLPAIRIAAGLLAAGKRRVDVVHTELCTLHLDPRDHGAEQLVAQALFADGIVRYSLEARDATRPQATAALGAAADLQLCAAREEVVPDSLGEMGWHLSEYGMQIQLSRRVPRRIQPVLAGYLERLARDARLEADALRERAVFAVHPGGPRIIDQVGAALGLREEQLAWSEAVLESHGNMSSATLPHIWQAIAHDSALAHGTHVVALAFGPGLTVSGAILRKDARP